MKTDIEIASEYQSKFRFYFVALVFTLLAASIQSAPLSEMVLFSKVAELIGWLSLLISGLLSLSYIEYSAVIYNHRDTIKNVTMDDEDKGQVGAQLKSIQEMSSLKYTVAKYAFVIGLLAILVSRAVHGFTT